MQTRKCETCESWFGCGPGGVCELEFEEDLERYLDRAELQDDESGIAAWWALNWSLVHVGGEKHEACDKWMEAW